MSAGPGPARPTPPEGLFVSLEEQLANVRRWNADWEWGFTDEDLDAVDLTPPDHPEPLVVDVVAVYLDELYLGEDLEPMDGVRRTCHELWTLASERQPNTWSWDWYQHLWWGRPKPVRLLDGIAHRPGVRRVTLDLAAHWQPGRHSRPGNVRGRDSAHAEILAAAAHFPRWARAMDGVTVPYIWLSGYQVTIPETSAHLRLPGLAWVGYRRTLSLTVDWADHSHPGWASPVCLD